MLGQRNPNGLEFCGVIKDDTAITLATFTLISQQFRPNVLHTPTMHSHLMCKVLVERKRNLTLLFLTKIDLKNLVMTCNAIFCLE